MNNACYRFATPADNRRLIDLTASAGMEGETALRIDRAPDFFKLLEKRGESKVFVAQIDQGIIGSLCISLQQLFIDGEPYPVHYIGDFKVDPRFRGRGVGAGLCNAAADYLFSVDADLVFLTVAKGNRRPLSFFKNRPGVPDFTDIGTFLIHQFIGMNKRNTSNRIIQTAVTDELLEFMNSRFRDYQLGCVITQRELEDTENHVVVENGRIVAAMSLMDTMEYKQNVVLKMKSTDRMMITILNAFGRSFGISPMPFVNSPVRTIYLRYLAVNSDKYSLARAMVDHARRIAYDRSYSFVSLGLHEKDPLNNFLPSFPRFTFRANGKFVSMKNKKELVDKILLGVPYEDFALV